MKTVQTILIPTDIAFLSVRAIQKGISLLQSRERSVRMLLLHTFLPASSAAADVIALNDRLKQASIEGLARQTASLKALFPQGEVVIESLSQLGTWEQVIPRVAQAEGVDAILVCLSDEVQNKLLPRLIGRVSCPMFILPAKDSLPD